MNGKLLKRGFKLRLLWLLGHFNGGIGVYCLFRMAQFVYHQDWPWACLYVFGAALNFAVATDAIEMYKRYK